MNKPFLSVSDVSMAFPIKGNGRFLALDSISMEVAKNEFVCLIGHSGCGKSTLLRHIIGSMKPTSGSVKIFGEEITTMREREIESVRRRFGMLFQSGALLASLTVGENVALPLSQHTDKSIDEIEEIVEQKLQMVGLSGFENLKPAEISGGMKKRAAVARALAMDPEILFFDEPSAGLDPIIAAGIDHLILQLKKAFHMTVIVVTHELDSAFLIADRMMLIDKGQVVASGTPEEMRSSTQSRVRQFLDRVAEPEVSQELDYLQMLTEGNRGAGRMPGWRRGA